MRLAIPINRMSKQYLSWFLKEHQIEELTDVLHNARRFYESTYGILKTVPTQMLFQNSLLECHPEKITGLLYLLRVQNHEKNLFWIGKLYFALPLPPDWIVQATSFDTKKFFFQSLKSDFHPAIAYVLFLIHTFRSVDNQISTVPSREINNHKNTCHFVKNDFRSNGETVNTFALNPFKLIEQNLNISSKIVAVSLVKEFQVFEKRFDFLLRSEQKLITFVLSMPQRRSRNYISSFKKTKDSVPLQNTLTSNTVKRGKVYNIKVKHSNFFDVIENKENHLTDSTMTAKRYYYSQSRRPKSQQNSSKIKVDGASAQKLKNWNQPQPPKITWASRLSMSNTVDRVLGQQREETEPDVFTVHDRIYQLRNTPLKTFMQSATVNLTQKEIVHLKHQLQTQKVLIPMNKLWSSLGKVQAKGFGDAARAPMNQTGSKLIQLRK